MSANELNTKIENALKDTNIIKIMNKASKRFKNQLDKDSIKTCQLNALWKTFLNHKPEKGAKFTTYLYMGVFIECIREIKFLSKKYPCTSKLHDNIASSKDPFLLVDIMDILTLEEQKLIEDKMSNMTINEIANKYSKNRETIRKKIHNIMDKIKNKFQ